MAQGIFTNILQQGRTDRNTTGFIKPGTNEARDWYRSKAQEIRSVKVESIVRNNPAYNRNLIRPGFMYLFNYDPKMKDELPYYDRYPLVFPFKATEDGFLGMNLHYIPHIYRARLMDQLYNLVNNNKFNETTKIRASYSFLNSASRYKYFKPCVKQYLYSHVRSKFLLVPANEWDLALFLPLERFVKKNKFTVYRDSREIINGI